MSKREVKDFEVQRTEFMKLKGMIHEKRPTIKTADSNSMNTSHIGGSFAQERKSIKRKKDKTIESNLDSKNTINDVSEKGDDTTSMASGRTGSKNTINI